jgi:hypothetical protein
MSEIDRASRTSIVTFPARPCDRPRRGHSGLFGTVLRAAGAVAAATIPGARAVVDAVEGAVDRRRSPLAGPIGGESETLRYLELQRDIERETRMFETASNMMKARHDATMSSIRNIKS